MEVRTKSKPISIAIQAFNIRGMFPGTNVNTDRDQSLTWTHTLTPSPLGGGYKVKLLYKTGANPKVFVIDPKPLAKAPQKINLPHCYNTITQQLCLFYPNGMEWNKSMLLTRTVIPWTYEWLYHYEIWLGNGGNWTGGGVHPVTKKKS